MKFCTVCKTKLERDVENSTDYAICPKCNMPAKEKLDEKITHEWETLFHQYLVGMYGYTNEDKNKTWGQNISFYISHYLEVILSDKGHSNIIIGEISAI